MEADRHAVAGADEDLALAVGELHARSRASPSSTPIAMMPPARGLLNADSSVFLTVPLRRAHHDELLVVVELPDGEQRGDLLVRLHRHEVGDRLALAGRPRRPGSRGPSASSARPRSEKIMM